MSGSQRRRREKLFSVYVGNLHPDITKEHILNLFGKCGKVEDLFIMEPKANQSSRFGFVRYGCIEHAVRAIKELNGWRVKSLKIIVDLSNETFLKIKNDPKHVPVASVPDSDALLPVVSHIDSMKNMVRVKEACVRVNLEAFSHIGIVNVSKINSQLEKNPYSDIIRTSKPVKPRSFLDNNDPMLKAFRKLSKETFSTSAPKSQVSNATSKNHIVMETLSKLLKSVEMSETLGKERSCLSRINLDPASQNHNLMEKSTLAMHSQTSQTVCTTSAETHCACMSKDPYTNFSLTKDSSRTTLNPQNVANSNGNQKAFSFHEFRKKINTSERDVEHKEHLEWQCSRNKLVDLDAVILKNKFDALSSSSDEKLISSNANSQDVRTNLKICENNDISWLPPSLHNSGLARLAGKKLRPAVLTGLQVPFLSSFKHKGYNSDGSSSTESSSSLSS